MLKKSTQDGFTLIELLMVILVIAILAVIAITQFVNYGKDSRDAATKANLQIIRRAISEKNGMIRIRCNVQDSRFPLTAAINANSILSPAYVLGDATTSPCQATDVPIAADQLFVAAGIPVNPWSDDIHSTPNNSNTVYECTSCTKPVPGGAWADCNGVSDHGWCYNPITGDVWANSAANDGNGIAHTGTEFTY
jgi:prepilin-type N-terminal cleavage/methylation domain-containing protein